MLKKVVWLLGTVLCFALWNFFLLLQHMACFDLWGDLPPQYYLIAGAFALLQYALLYCNKKYLRSKVMLLLCGIVHICYALPGFYLVSWAVLLKRFPENFVAYDFCLDILGLVILFLCCKSLMFPGKRKASSAAEG